jgi:DedD protein
MMAEHATSADTELQLKKRARRRLVGATALALLAVIVLPMVMDREPRPPAQDIQLRIPNPESTTLPSLHPSVSPPVEHSVADNQPPLPPAETPSTAVGPSPSPVEQSAGAQVATSPASPPAEQQWIVQLGAYKDDKNVRLLLAKLKELKLPTYTEKIGENQDARTRVRCGPFPSREAADKAQARIAKIGVNGTVAAK